MTRVEHIGPHTLYLGDAREIVSGLDVNAVVSDPPYGIKVRTGTRSTRANDSYAGGSYHKAHGVRWKAGMVGDDLPFDPAPFVSVPAVLWGAQNFACSLPPKNGWLCWSKCGGIKGFAMSECELAWTNFLTTTRVFDHLWHGFKRASEVGHPVLHETQKPVALMRWCIEHLPPGCDTILDPFMGSGTTGVACQKLGRKFIGIEIEPKYFDIACRRIDEAMRQPDLFVEQPTKAEQLDLMEITQ